MTNPVVSEPKRHLISVPCKIPSDSKLFIVLLATVVMLPSLSIDSCLASLTKIGISLPLGAFTSGRLSNVPAKQMVSTGLAIGLVASVLLVLLTVRQALTPLSAMPWLMLNTFSIGVVTPNVVHGTLEPVPEIAGVASSLFGSLRMMAGAISTELVAFCYNRTPTAMTGTMLLFAASAFGFWLISIPSLREGRRTASFSTENSCVIQ